MDIEKTAKKDSDATSFNLIRRSFSTESKKQEVTKAATLEQIKDEIEQVWPPMEDRLSKEDANALTKKVVDKMYPGYAKVIDNSFEDCFLVLDLEPIGIRKDELAVLVKSLITIVSSV